MNAWFGYFHGYIKLAIFINRTARGSSERPRSLELRQQEEKNAHYWALFLRCLVWMGGKFIIVCVMRIVRRVC